MKKITITILVIFILIALTIYNDTGSTPGKPTSSDAEIAQTETPREAAARIRRSQDFILANNPNFKLIWQRVVIPNLPPPRMGFAVALDATNRRALLFGGLNSTTGDLDDLWATDGNDWTQVLPSRKPIERVGANFIYDEARQEAILFGGWHNAEYLGNTWKYTPYEWVQQIPPISPPARADASMAYDAARENTVLFGGINWTGEKNYLSDTWIWDGAQWEQQFSSTAPNARFSANMAYDRARENVVLFGGATSSGVLDDTWIWDGQKWIEQHPAHSPPGRSDFSMTYDDVRQQVILFGGSTISGTSTDTWGWDGHDWTKLPTFLVPPMEIASNAQLVYLPDLQTTVLIGDYRNGNCSTGDCAYNEETQVWALAYRYLSYLPTLIR